jgi:hypothetical protein
MRRQSIATTLPPLEDFLPRRIETHRSAPDQNRARPRLLGKSGLLRFSRSIVASPVRTKRTNVWRLKPLKNIGCFGSTERNAGKQLECQALLCAEMIFSKQRWHLRRLNERLRRDPSAKKPIQTFTQTRKQQLCCFAG